MTTLMKETATAQARARTAAAECIRACYYSKQRGMRTRYAAVRFPVAPRLHFIDNATGKKCHFVKRMGVYFMRDVACAHATSRG